jgi:phage tail sheath protein FI
MATYSRPGVYISEALLPAPISTASTAEAAGAAIGEFAKGPTSVTRVTSWYEFVKRFGGYDASYPATFGIGQYFLNGGAELYVRRVINTTNAAKADVDVPHTANGSDTTVTIAAKDYGTDGNNLRVQFTQSTKGAAYFNLTVFLESGGDTGTTADDIVVERYNDITISDKTSTDFIETVVNLRSTYITATRVDGSGGAYIGHPVLTVLPLTGGANGDAATKTHYSGVINDFGTIDRPLVLFAPGVHGKLGASDSVDVQNNLVAWAEANNGFVVIDTPSGLTATGSSSSALDYAADVTVSSSAAVYFPNYYITDPVGRSNQSLRLIGPAGAVAGLYIQTDKAQGPFKAPAGVGANIRGALALEQAFTSAELDSLNASATPVNPLRNLPGAGIVAMGARTMLQDGTANKYVNMRRSLIYIKKNLNDITQFALFENNNEVLWGRLRTTISAFLNAYFNQGGLRGTTPSQAYFIKVDAENNTADTIANGEVHIEVGVALQYPAEFVVINLSQKTAN